MRLGPGAGHGQDVLVMSNQAMSGPSLAGARAAAVCLTARRADAGHYSLTG
jgi:hypothetical protein